MTLCLLITLKLHVLVVSWLILSLKIQLQLLDFISLVMHNYSWSWPVTHDTWEKYNHLTIEVLNIILFTMIKNCKKTFKKLFNGRCSTLAECHYQVIFKSLLQLRLNPCKMYCFSLKFIYQFLLDVKLCSQCWDPVTSF